MSDCAEDDIDLDAFRRIWVERLGGAAAFNSELHTRALQALEDGHLNYEEAAAPESLGAARTEHLYACSRCEQLVGLLRDGLPNPAVLASELAAEATALSAQHRFGVGSAWAVGVPASAVSLVLSRTNANGQLGVFALACAGILAGGFLFHHARAVATSLGVQGPSRGLPLVAQLAVALTMAITSIGVAAAEGAAIVRNRPAERASTTAITPAPAAAPVASPVRRRPKVNVVGGPLAAFDRFRFDAICAHRNCLEHADRSFKSSPKEASEHYLAACSEGHARGCVSFFAMCNKRPGCSTVNLDDDLLLRLKVRTCGIGLEETAQDWQRVTQGRICLEVGKTLAERKAYAAARQAFVQGVTDGNAGAKEKLGELLMNDDSAFDESLRLLTEACDAGIPTACGSAAWKINRKKDRSYEEKATARELYDKGCDGNNLASCQGLLDMARHGIGGRKSPKLVGELRAKIDQLRSERRAAEEAAQP